MPDNGPKRLFSSAYSRESGSCGYFDSFTSLGRYALRRRLGSSCSGSVYSAYDPEVEREVAVNLMLAHDTTPSGLRALTRKVASWSALSHPHLLKVYESGVYIESRPPHRRGAYIVRDLVLGMDLQRWLDASNRAYGTTDAQLIDMFFVAGDALAAAHDYGLAHGGFSPASVLVGYDGCVTVDDFTTPLARPLAGHPSYLTAAYAAPEVQDGAEPTPHSDQFSFCASMITSLGRARFGRLPKRVASVLQRGTEYVPDARWPSMHALLAALRHAKHGLLRRRLFSRSVNRPAFAS